MNIHLILSRALLVAALVGFLGALVYLPSFSFNGMVAERYAGKLDCQQKNAFIRTLAESNESLARFSIVFVMTQTMLAVGIFFCRSRASIGSTK